MHMEMYCKAFT